MSRHTSWHVGGPGGGVLQFRATGRTCLRSSNRCRTIVPVHWIGLGSNLLVRDSGVRGVVVSTIGTLDRLDRLNQTTVYCEAGVACARVAKQCVKWGLGPAEFFAGIPGTLGGALAMNAGAFGGETWAQVIDVLTMDRHGREQRRTASELPGGLSECRGSGPGRVVIAARLKFEHKPGMNETKVRELLEKRKASQLSGNGAAAPCLRTLQAITRRASWRHRGLKGYRVGDASVSEKHANFIINHGNATSEDLERLIGHIQETVEREHGIRLHPEFRIMGTTD